MNNLPQLPPLPICSPQETGPEGSEIFYPKWECFCCRDSGIVDPHLARLVVPEYNHTRDRLPLCQMPGCSAFKNWDSLTIENLDTRFTPSICQQLDQINREDWRQTRTELFELARKRIKDAADAKNIRQCDRNSTEESIAEQRHQAALSGWGVEPYTKEEKEFIKEFKEAREEEL